MKASQPLETPSCCPRHPHSLGQEKGGEIKELKENKQWMGEGMNHQEETLRSGNHTQQLPVSRAVALLGGEQTQKHLAVVLTLCYYCSAPKQRFPL